MPLDHAYLRSYAAAAPIARNYPQAPGTERLSKPYRETSKLRFLLILANASYHYRLSSHF